MCISIKWYFWISDISPFRRLVSTSRRSWFELSWLWCSRQKRTGLVKALSISTILYDNDLRWSIVMILLAEIESACKRSFDFNRIQIIWYIWIISIKWHVEHKWLKNHFWFVLKSHHSIDMIHIYRMMCQSFREKNII